MSNSTRWKRSTPGSIRSPFFAQADIGFISYKNKKYGLFFAAINTFTRRLFCYIIKNNKSENLIVAIENMLKDKYFKLTNTLLFDGESGLRSAKSQNILYDRFKLNVHAESIYKRNMIERAIREIKLRLALILDQRKEPLKNWKNYLSEVVQILNGAQKEYKSTNAMLTDYFTTPSTVIPQVDLFKFQINDKVEIDLTPKQRRDLSFKWSLHKGHKIKL